TGKSIIENIQPLLHPHPITRQKAEITISHNGNIPNARKIREELENKGIKFHTHTDTEIILKLIEQSKGSLEEKVIDAFGSINGSFSSIITTKDTLIAIKDPWGNRPLCYGKLNGGYIFASESGALYKVGAEYIRELDPGEMIVVNNHGEKNYHALEKRQLQFCLFEHVYFAMPDSILNGKANANTQEDCGRISYRESGVDADLVAPVLNSGKYFSSGIAKESGIEFDLAILKNDYVGRTFIMAEQVKRSSSVKVKFSPLTYKIKGKRILLGEDSLVRGTTMQNLVRELLDSHGAKEVHLRIGSPPNRYPCYYGIDTPERNQLIAARMNVEEIRKFTGATTLAYLNLDGLLSACPGKPETYCTACFTGKYEIPLNGLEVGMN
ncbi:MAG: amidophosphoribosyltransferase, partial [Nanoarchaeota archaeon]|nr:amidophosphoribosyltransferase [Nanoarchaeota archaeon]